MTYGNILSCDQVVSEVSCLKGLLAKVIISMVCMSWLHVVDAGFLYADCGQKSTLPASCKEFSSW